MRIYVDSSALVKRVVVEEFSEEVDRAIEDWQGHDLVTSGLTPVEVSRSLRRRLDDVAPEIITASCEDALSGVVEHPLSGAVLSIARRIGPPTIRSLDAIHLAAATLLEADVVVTYDERMRTTAQELGFATEAPGQR